MTLRYNYRDSSFKRRHLSNVSSARTSRYGTRHPSEDDIESVSISGNDETDMGLWNEESIPLLQKTVNQARTMGAKRNLSVGCNLQEVPLKEELHSGWSWVRIGKVSVLTFLCAFLVFLLLFFPEEKFDLNLITVDRYKDFQFDIDNLYQSTNKGPYAKILDITIQGAFLPESATDLSPEKLIIIVKQDDHPFNTSALTKRDMWKVGVVQPDLFGFFSSKPVSLSHKFNLFGVDLKHENVSLVFYTESSDYIPLSVKIQLVSERVDRGVLYGGIILVAMYICISFEIANRTVIAMLSATTSIAVLATLNERPTLESIISWLDIETLTLLFSMMIIVSILSETGVFNWVGLWAFKISKGKVWPLLTILCLITALVSAVLDNVTTILLMTPIVIQLCETINIDPVRVLIANVIFSNIGGTATAIGDPPNVLIASSPSIQEYDVTFVNFTLHTGLCVIFVFIASYILLRILYRKLENSHEDREIHDIQHEIVIWHRTSQGLSSFSKEEAMVKEIIQIKLDELQEELEQKIADRLKHGKGPDPPSLSELEESCKITDKTLLIKSGFVLTGVVILFFLQNIPSLNLSLGWSALLGAITLLVLTDKLEIDAIFSRVEWTTLIFFASLFVVMEALAKLGFLNWIGSLVEEAILSVPLDYRLAAALLLILWVSGICSAIIDNIPFTTMMIPVITNLGKNPDVQIPIQPLIWALSLGACLGGNGTLIGASANVVCAGVAEQHGYKFTFWNFFKTGFPVTIVSLLVASIYLLVCHVALEWNG